MQTKPYSIQAPESIAKEYGGDKNKIAQAMQMGLVDPTAGLLAGMFVDRMRSAQALEQAPQQTVAQQVFAPPAPAAPMGIGSPPPGGAGAPGPAAVPTQQPQGGLPAAPGAEGMFTPQSMAGGGIVSFADGGETDGDRKKELLRIISSKNSSSEERRDAMVELNHMTGLGKASLSGLPDLSGALEATYEGPRGMDLIRSMLPARGETTYDPYMAKASIPIEPEADPYSAKASIGMYPPEEPKKGYPAPGWYGVGSRGKRAGFGDLADLLGGEPHEPPVIPEGRVGEHSRFGNQLSRIGNADAAGDVLAAANLGQAYSDIGGGIKRGLGSIYDYFMTPEDEIKARTSKKPAAKEYRTDGKGIPVSMDEYKPGYGEPDIGSGFSYSPFAFEEGKSGYSYPREKPSTGGGLGAAAAMRSRGPGYMGKTPATAGVPELMKQYQDLVGTPPEPEFLKGERADLEGQKNEDLWTALAQIGFGMAGTKSPYFAQAVGEAGSAAMPGIQKSIDSRRQAKKDLDRAAYQHELAKYGVKGDAAKAAISQYDKQQENATHIETARIQAGAQISAAQIRASVDRDLATKNPYIVAMNQAEIINDPQASDQAKTIAQAKLDIINKVMGADARDAAQDNANQFNRVRASKFVDDNLLTDREYRKLKGPARAAYRQRKINEYLSVSGGGGNGGSNVVDYGSLK